MSRVMTRASASVIAIATCHCAILRAEDGVNEKAKGEVRKLNAHAERAEAYADAAMVLALAGLDEAERPSSRLWRPGWTPTRRSSPVGLSGKRFDRQT